MLPHVTMPTLFDQKRIELHVVIGANRTWLAPSVVVTPLILPLLGHQYVEDLGRRQVSVSQGLGFRF